MFDLNGEKVWSQSAHEYLERDIPVVEARHNTPPGVQVPLMKGRHPEIDDTPPLSEDYYKLYMSYIGILLWTMC
jgi:hypothetical protein